MSEQPQVVEEWFLLPGAESGGMGTREAPWGSVDEALATLARRPGATLRDAAAGGRDVELVCLTDAGVPPPAAQAANHRLYIDPHATVAGNGTEAKPCQDWNEACQTLKNRLRTQQFRLAPGERLRFHVREAFTTTRFEMRKKRVETFARSVFLMMTLLLVAPVLLILGYLVVQAWPVLTPAFLYTNPQDYMTTGGIWAPLIGTFLLVLLSLLIAAPIGVLAGVYLNEYAGQNWWTRMINLAVVNLAGVPSIVHALFGVGAFVLFAGMGRSLLAAACTVAVMTLPVIITSSREALAAVPMAFREACWNLGASRWQTIRTIVLPNSISGILTGVILQVARAAGETAPILFTGAVFFVPIADSGLPYWLPYNWDDRFMALSMHLFTLSTQVKDVGDEVKFGTAVVLIGLVLAVNSLSIGLRVYLRSHKRW